jgi:TetR/AcrR family transcriptional regulator
MKKTFEKLPEDKKQRILTACIEEFGERGYEKGSTDKIIKRAGISKGGLYEYITTKEELFLYVVEYTYRQLYGYLERRIAEEIDEFPADLLQRLRVVSELAVDFYIDHPRYVSLIVRTHELHNDGIEEQVNASFIKHFTDVFGNSDDSRLRFEKGRITELVTWLLLKTRYEFLREFKSNKDTEVVKRNYLKNWDFYLSVLQGGIYTST